MRCPRCRSRFAPSAKLLLIGRGVCPHCEAGLEESRWAALLAAFAVPSPMLFPAVREWVQDMPYATLPVFFAIGMAVQTAAVFCGAINVRSSHEFGTGPKLAFGALLLGAIVLALLTFALFGAAMR